MRLLLLTPLLLLAACGEPVLTGTASVTDGVQLFYRAVGRGTDTVIVLPDGPALDGGYLIAPLKRLGSRHTFLIYDLRGRGRSMPGLDASELSAAADVRDLDAIRTWHRLPTLTIVGHGWGAGVAAQYAAAHPERVSRMLFIAPMFPRAVHIFGAAMVRYHDAGDSLGLAGLDSARLRQLDQREPVTFCRRYWGAWLSPRTVRDEATLRRLADDMCAAPDAALRRRDEINLIMMRSLGSWDWREGLRAINAPVLLLQGGLAQPPGDVNTISVWRTAAREWTEALPNSGIVFLDAHPQFPWLRQPGAFQRAAASFLEGNWPRDVVASRERR